MKNVRFLALALGAIILCSTSLSAQNKLGVVNSETIVKQLPEAKEADAQLTAIGQRYKDTLDMIQKDFTDRMEKYQKQASMMTADAKQKEEETLNAIRQRYGQFQEEKFGNQGIIARKRDEFLQPIKKKIEDAIKAVAKEEGVSLVLDAVSPSVLYSEEKLDLTFKVLDHIKRGAGEETKKESKGGKK